MKAICWENSPLMELQIRGIMPLQKLIEKISDNGKEADLLEISKGIEDTLQRLNQEMPKQIRAVTIDDEFIELGTIGEFLKFMNDAASNSGGNTPYAMEEMVLHFTEEGIIHLNRAMESLAENFPGNEFEPINLE